MSVGEGVCVVFFVVLLEECLACAIRFVAHVQKSITRDFQQRRLYALCSTALSFAVPPTEQTRLSDEIVTQLSQHAHTDP